MHVIEWSDTYLTGHPIIDHQHQALFREINQLSEDLVMNRDESELLHRVEHISEMTREHFRCEEQLMLEQHYPQLAEHQKEHREILDNGEALIKRYKEGGVPLAELLPRFIVTWAVQHIVDDDARLAAFMRQRSRE